MTDVLLDSDVLIDHLLGAVRRVVTGDAAYSSVSRCELFAGRQADEDTINLLLAPIVELPVDRDVAESGGGRGGGTVSTPDALVAATALLHDLVLVTRDAKRFAGIEGLRVRQPDAEAAAFAEVLVNCTAGLHSVDAPRAAGEEHLGGKVVVDISNALDFSNGSPPRAALPDEGNVAQQLQAAFPDARVVKTLNTMTAADMVEPGLLPGGHSVFLSGEDAAAKRGGSASCSPTSAGDPRASSTSAASHRPRRRALPPAVAEPHGHRQLALFNVAAVRACS